MGMFDWVNFNMKCPKCESEKASGVDWQFRDLRPMGLTAQPDLEAARALAGHGTSAITNRVYRRAGERAKPNN